VSLWVYLVKSKIKFRTVATLPRAVRCSITQLDLIHKKMFKHILSMLSTRWKRFCGKLPLFFIYFTLSEHTYNIYIYNSSRTASCCLHRFRSVEGLLWGAEPRYELGPALQQADALLFVPDRSLRKRFYACWACAKNAFLHAQPS
jgi:hypothetical protein